ncbi:MAG TPA: hypothetical protein VJ499_08950 [Flavisolibacter sp.]|nr:hypothetical protein [Flavisolibacter sp.]
MTKMLSIISMIILFGFGSYSYECDLTGHLVKPASSTYLSVKMIDVLVKGDGKLLGKTKTDRNGNFRLFFQVNRENEFRFYAVPVKGDTVFLKSVTRFENQEPSMVFYLPSKK